MLLHYTSFHTGDEVQRTDTGRRATLVSCGRRHARLMWRDGMEELVPVFLIKPAQAEETEEE